MKIGCAVSLSRDSVDFVKVAAFNSRIRDIWRNFANESPPHPGTIREPLVVVPVRSRALLFVGMNPSFSYKAMKKPIPDIDAQYAFRSDLKVRDDLETLPAYENKYAYFGAFNEMQEKTGLLWDHIDLFYVRETNQKRVLEWVTGNGRANEFGRAQLAVTMDILVAANPAVIVVANACAARLFSSDLFPNAKWNERIGCYLLPLGSDSVPVFYSSMLSGQRALDIESRKRLTWHISFAIRQLQQSATE